MNKTITTLYIFHEASASGGATYSGLNMIRSLDRSKITPLVLLPGDGDFKQQLEDLGVKCIIAPIVCFEPMMNRFFLSDAYMHVQDSEFM